MKKGIWIVITFFAFTLSTVIAAKAEGVIIYGCYQKINGQLRVVSSPDECLPSEKPITLNGQTLETNNFINLYVNSQKGVDDYGWGFDPDTPFKTINYTLKKVPILRPNTDVALTINLADGLYSESITIDKSNIWLRGTSAKNTIIMGEDSSVAVYIKGCVAVRVSDLTIKNGRRGLLCYSSSVGIQRSIIEKNIGDCGVCLADNSHANIKDTLIKDNQSTGLAGFRNCSMWLENSEVSYNKSYGIDISYNSSISINQSIINNNEGTGVQAVGGSSIRMYQTEVSNNKISGISVTENASVALRGSNKVFQNGDGFGWRGGINAAHGSTVVLNDSSSSELNMVYDNNGPGIFLGNSCNLFINSAKIYSNKGHGIGLQFDSSAQFGGLEKSYLTISDNNGYGVSCEHEYWKDSKYHLGPGVITNFSNNSSGFTNCYNYNSP